MEERSDEDLDRSLRSLSHALDRGPIADLRRALVRNRLLSTEPTGVRCGRFTLLRQIGGGAMGAVYEAHDDILERKIALKLVRAESDTAKSRASREARALAKLNHPHVVTVHEIGEHEGHLFIAMELVAGETLEVWRRGAPRRWKEVLAVFEQAGRGLAAAHAAGVIHRDFKPANAMIGDDGRVRVLDFGLAMKGDEEVMPNSAGTPGFIAPEIRRGAEADAQSDQYSFAIALHRALFEEQLNGCPKTIAAVLRRGFDDDPQKRWPSMSALLNELDRAVRAGQRRKELAFVVPAACVALLVLFALRQIQENGASEDLERLRDLRLIETAQQLSVRDPGAAASALLEVSAPEKVAGWRPAAIAVLQQVPLVTHLGVPSRRSKFHGERGTIFSWVSGRNWVSWTFGQGELAHVLEENLEEPSPLPLFVTPDHHLFRRSRSDAVIGGTSPSAGRSGDPNPARSNAARSDAARSDAELRSANRAEVLSDLSPWLDPRGEPWTFRGGVRGRYFAALGNDGEVLLFDVDDLKRPPIALDTHQHGLSAIFSGDESLVAFWSNTETFWLLSTDHHAPPQKVVNPEGALACIAINADGSRMLSAPREGSARLWDLGAPGLRSFPIGHGGGVFLAEFSPDGSRVATASHDRSVRVTDLDEGRSYVLGGHLEGVVHLAFSADGKQIATSALDGVRIFDLDAPRAYLLTGHEGQIWSASLSHDHSRLATAGFDSTARIWRLDGKTEPPLILRGHTSRDVYTAIFSADDQLLATGGNDGTARLWDVHTGEQRRVFSGHSQWVYGLAFTADGNWLATGDKAGALRLWSLHDAGAMQLLEPGCERRNPRLDLLTLSWDGRQIAARACGCGGDTCVFHLDDFTPAGRLHDAAYSDARAFAFIDGERVAIPDEHGGLAVWRPGDVKAQYIFSAGTSRIFALAVSSDRRKIAAAASDGSMRVFEVDRPDPIAIFSGHDDWVVDVHFDRQARRLVTASYDGTARVFSLEHPEETIVLRGHTDKLRFADFVDDHRIATASFDGTVRIWRVELEDDIDTLKSSLVAFAHSPERRTALSSK